MSSCRGSVSSGARLRSEPVTDLLPDFLFVLLGLALLTAGAEAVVRGAGALARRLGVSALLVGLTVVAFGTSAPELAVSLRAATAGRGDVALGNVVGSNIFNVLVILGLSAVITPLVVRRQLVRVDVPIMVGVSFLPLILGWNGLISPGEGFLLAGLLVAYLLVLVRVAVRTRSAKPAKLPSGSTPAPRPWPLHVLLALVGLVCLAAGGEVLVGGAAGLARAAGVSELVIGLTLVAGATSLPEVATSVVASLRGERDLAIGNVVGSNVFNVLGVLGASAAASGGLSVPSGVRAFDFPVMIAVGLVCLPVFVSGARISRLEGGAFLLFYGVYLTYLALHATDHPFQDEFGRIVIGFVLPITIALAGAIYLRAREASRAG